MKVVVSVMMLKTDDHRFVDLMDVWNVSEE